MSKRIKNMMTIMNNINDEHAFRHVLYTFVKIGSTQSLFIACPRDSACNINLVVLYEKAMTDTTFRFYLGHHKNAAVSDIAFAAPTKQHTQLVTMHPLQRTDK